MGQPIEVVKLAIPYLFWVSISLLAVVNFQSFRQFADGMSITKAAMYSVLAANLINVILNYLLIFGNEINGVDQKVINCSSEVIEIEQYGTKHSLNISIAAGILIWRFFNLLRKN